MINRDPIEKLEEKHQRKANTAEDERQAEYHQEMARAFRRSMARSSIAWWEQKLEEYREELAKLEADDQGDSARADKCREMIGTCTDMLRKMERGMEKLEE